jgi:4-deoxy-L-threo-5-hexosulose-uronate ketol-isomerase
MPTSYDERFAVHPDDYPRYQTARLRELFLVSDLFAPGNVRLSYNHYDRIIVGGVLPVGGAVELEAIEPLKAEYFLERRELGAINIGGPGQVEVDGETFAIDTKEALYVGKGARRVAFASEDAKRPAKFYLNSTPAHQSHPSRKVGQKDADVLELGSLQTSNARTIRKLLVNTVIQTCQLQMGMTELQPGSVWNTMPAHTHSRRMEVYFYFNLPPSQAVCHFMGPREETRHIWVKNEEAVVSPPWSMHCGAGTTNYTFIWGMAGENLDYGDMDGITPDMLR